MISTFDKFKVAIKTYAEHLYQENKEIKDNMLFAVFEAIDNLEESKLK